MFAIELPWNFFNAFAVDAKHAQNVNCNESIALFSMPSIRSFFDAIFVHVCEPFYYLR